MDSITVQKRRRIASCVAIGIGMAAPIVFGSLELKRAERASIEAQTAFRAEGLAARIQSQLDLRLSLLKHVARALDAEKKIDKALFHKHAEQITSTFPEFYAVNLIDREGLVIASLPAGRDPDLRGKSLFEVPEVKDAFERAHKSEQPQVADISRTLANIDGFSTYYPIGALGFVNGIFDANLILKSALPHDIETETFLRYVPKKGIESHRTLEETRTFSVLGTHFKFAASPAPPVVHRLGMSSRLMLGFGILLAAISAFVIHEMLAHRERASEQEVHERALLSAVSDHVVRLNPSCMVMAYHQSSNAPRLPLELHRTARFPSELVRTIDACIANAETQTLSISLQGRRLHTRIVPEPEGCLVCFRDITDQERTEAERSLLSKLVTASGQLAAVTDAKGKLHYLNPAGSNLLGILSSDESSLADFIDLTSEILEPLNGGTSFSGRVQITSANGDTITAQLTSFCIPTKDGHRLGIHAADMSDSIALERQLIHAGKMEAVGSLAAGVAHDFNNALSVFRTGVELLESTEGMPKEALEDISLMRTAAESASYIAGQLLALSRPSSSSKGRCNVDETLSKSSKMLTRVLREDIHLNLELCATGGAVRCDEGALQQVIMNLVKNARDAVLGPGTIRIRTTQPTGSHCIHIEVTDSGCGIPVAEQARVFEPFYTTKSAGAGNGLGLAMVARIVDAAKGRLELDSEEERGTTVRVILPALHEQDETSKTTLVPASKGKAARILLADDDPKLRKLLRRALEKAGHQVKEASDGLEAIALLEAGTPVDLILADLGMPRLGGAELAFWAARERPTIKMLFMTGYTDTEGFEQANDVDVLLKPVVPSLVLQRIDRTLHGRAPSQTAALMTAKAP